MKLLSTSALTLLLAPLVLAQTPRGAAPAAAAATPLTAAQVGAELKAARVIPDVISDFTPKGALVVDYGKQTPLKMGEEMLPSEVGTPPKVSFDASEKGKFYTLVITDPGVLDAKTLRGPNENAWQWLHWIVVNIPGGADFSPAEGMEVMPYGPPAPPAGLHRYSFVVFEQKAATIKPVAPDTRGGWDTRAFAKENGLTPVSGFYFLAQPQTAQ